MNKIASGKISGLKEDFRVNRRQYTMIIVLLVLGVIMTILTKGTFVSSRNISNLFLQTSAVAILAVCMCLVIVSGEIDLSAGSALGLTGGVAAVLMVNFGWETLPAVLVALAVGVAIGCWQGFWVAYIKIPSFIVTLAGQLIFRGILLGITDGRTLAPMNDSYKAIGQNFLPDLTASQSGGGPNVTAVIIGVVLSIIVIMLQFRTRSRKLHHGLNVPSVTETWIKTIVMCFAIMAIMLLLAYNQGIPIVLVLMLICAVIFSYISTNTVFGRQLFAIGGNRDAARLSGINIKKRIFSVFVLMGFMSAVSGIVYSARINAGAPSAGDQMEFNAISSAIIGGTSLAGGEGSVFGAVIGAFIITFIDNGMSLMDVSTVYKYVVKGLVLLVSVWIDVASRSKAEA